MSRAIVTILAALPWLGMLPFHGVAAVLAHVCTLLAAFHGAGQALAWAVRRHDLAPTLAIQWGIAVLVTLSGALMTLHVFGFTAHVVLVNGFAAVHTVVVVRRARAYAADLRTMSVRSHLWLVPTLLLVALGALHILAAAGDLGARPFDDDGHVLAQLERLRDTGTLGDGLGYARHSQLGGQLVLTALATVPGDVHLARYVEPIAFVLALALALARLGLRDAFGALLGILLVIAGVALALVPADPVTCWTAVGLILALHAALHDRPRPPAVVIGLLAGALITLRFELAPIAFVALVVAWRQVATPVRAGVLASSAMSALVPYVVVRQMALDGVETSLLLDPRLSVLLGLAVFAGACVACAPIVIWTRRSSLRWYGVATAVTLAGIAGEVTGARPYALRFLWPVAIAFAVLLVIELARTRTLTVALMIVSMLVGAVIHHGRSATGRVKWTRRYLDYAMHVEYLHTVGDHAPVSAGYAELLERVPRGSTVAVWVQRPERLPYDTGLRLLDLRTPRAARRPAKLEAITRGAHATYALIEQHDELLSRHQVIAKAGGVALVRLTGSP